MFLLQRGARHFARHGLHPVGALKPGAKAMCLSSARGYRNHPSYAGTMEEINYECIKRLGLERGYQPIPKSRESLNTYVPEPDDLPPRSMQDSFTSAIIPLKSDPELQEKYVSFIGGVRMGRLLEDMDMFAVWVCHKHLLIPKLPTDTPLPYTFVTVLVDRMTFGAAETNVRLDVRLSGHVCWVGRSSMEIVVWTEEIENKARRRITRALFMMVARNATNTRAAPVNRILPANDKEKKILEGGEQRQKRRKQIKASSIFKVEPNDLEMTIMYDIFKRTSSTKTMELNKRILPDDCRWMSQSFASNTISSFPENRNAQNTVFGGFLMRNALQITWATAWLYSKTRPRVVHVSDISFENPVSVDSIIKMTAYVVYTQVNYIQMMTVADVLDASSGNQMTSNVFYFTLSAPDIVPEVLPRSYHENIWYIQGRRKFYDALQLNDDIPAVKTNTTKSTASGISTP